MIRIADKMAIDNQVLSDERKDSNALPKERLKDIYRLLNLFDELYVEAVKNKR